MHLKKLKNSIKSLIISGLVLFSLFSSGQIPKTDIPLKNGVLLFNSGFEAESRIVHGTNPFISDDAIIGKDMSVPPPNDWVEDFDIINFTHNSTNPEPNGFTFWNPLKLYITNRDRMEFLRSREKAIQLYFDDLEVWVDEFPKK